MNNICYMFNTKNTTIDFGMPHWHFMQQVATRGSANRQGNVFCNTGSYILPYILQKKIVIINQHIRIHSTAC